MNDQIKDAGAAYLADESLLRSNHSREVLNQVPEGFKQTELGIIPEDWEVVKLGSIATVHDGTHQTPRYAPFGIPFYSVEHVTRRDFSNTKYISPDEHRFLTRSFKIERGDVLMTRIGSIGECVHVDWDVEASFYVSLALLKIHGAQASYIAAYSESSSFKNEVDLHSLPSATPKKINLGPISDIRLVLPRNSSEQTAIANALSDVDALIDSLEALIAKKQAIKTATMQQLLTGHTRLQQFARHSDGSLKGTQHTELGEIPEDWEIRKLFDLAAIKSGGTPLTGVAEYWNGDINWCTPTDITALNGKKYLYTTARKITDEAVLKSAAEIFPSGTIVMTSRATIGECAIACEEITTNQGFKSFVCHEQTNNEFLYYLLGTQKDRFIGLCGGSTFLEISTTQVRNFLVTVPESAEQEAIANILSDMDTEIQVLEQRLSKTRQLKQGMMQELLTGRTRLVQHGKDVA